MNIMKCFVRSGEPGQVGPAGPPGEKGPKGSAGTFQHRPQEMFSLHLSQQPNQRCSERHTYCMSDTETMQFITQFIISV